MKETVNYSRHKVAINYSKKRNSWLQQDSKRNGPLLTDSNIYPVNSLLQERQSNTAVYIATHVQHRKLTIAREIKLFFAKEKQLTTA